MLILTKFIGKGATRLCFEHPADANKCVKVAAHNKDVYLLEQELFVHSCVKSYLGSYVVDYEPDLVDTNLGKGLVCELLRDDCGGYSETLSRNNLDKEVISELWGFTYHLLEHDIFFYDFNLKNFVIQIKNGQKNLRYTDLKSFMNYKSWAFLKLEKLITPLACHLMIRRLKRLFASLDIPMNRD